MPTGTPSPPARRRLRSARGGRLDALFNNGAYGQPGAVEDLTREVLEAQFAANVFGWHQLTRDCLPLMRANGHGRIVQCSSVLGLVALKWRGAYNASKFAIEALSDTLRLELRGTAIHVSLIEPGPIASKFSRERAQEFRAEHRRGAAPTTGRPMPASAPGWAAAAPPATSWGRRRCWRNSSMPSNPNARARAIM